MSDEHEKNGWDGRHDTPLCVTLERRISIPGPQHEPPEAEVFRAREHSQGDEYTWFYGLNIGPENTAVKVRNENIRGIAVIGNIGSGD